MGAASWRDLMAVSLKSFRQSAGFEFMADFAVEIGVSQNTVSRIESGATVPKPETIDAWLLACGKTSEDLANEIIRWNRYGYSAVVHELNRSHVPTKPRHGTRARYKSDGCRCRYCVEASREYHRARRSG